jgi:hypothetical protein
MSFDSGIGSNGGRGYEARQPRPKNTPFCRNQRHVVQTLFLFLLFLFVCRLLSLNEQVFILFRCAK